MCFDFSKLWRDNFREQLFNSSLKRRDINMFLLFTLHDKSLIFIFVLLYKFALVGLQHFNNGGGEVWR